jgi:hypothetical protein
MKRLAALGLLLALGSPWTAPTASASIVRALDLAALTSRADQIVVGDVEEVRSSWDSAHRTIVTTIDVAVRETWKGETPANGRIRLRQPGGRVGDIEMTVYGVPAFSVGERNLLFLGRNGLVGMGQGKRTLHRSADGDVWQVDVPDERGLLLVGANPARDGRAERSETLEVLRAKVRSLLRK